MLSNSGTQMTMPVAPANMGSFGGFGDGNSWVIWLFFLLAIIWGGNGFGGNGGVQDNYILTSDFSQLSRQISDSTAMTERKLDGISNGICSLGYDQLAQMNGINQNVSNTGYAIQNAIQADTVANLQNTNTLAAQMTNANNLTNSAISNLNYNLANQANSITNAMQSGFCQTNYNNSTNTRDIIDSQNAGTRAILEAIEANKVETLNQKIAEQNQIISGLQLSASQQAQNNYLVQQLGQKTPIPAYVVANPYCNCNCGCGC